MSAQTQAHDPAIRPASIPMTERASVVADRKVDSTLIVRSPIAGVITQRTAAPGLFVQPGIAPTLRWLALQTTGMQIGCSWCVDYGYYEGMHTGIDPAKVRALFGDIRRWRHGFAAWQLLFYALWHRRHILALPPAGDVFETLAAR